MTTTFLSIVFVAGVLGGGLAAVAGAGIGSILVPLLALRVDLKVAVAIATVPHLVGGLVRAVQLRHAIDRGVLFRFGIVCAVASFAGALVHTQVSSPLVTYFFAGLLVVAGLLSALGLTGRLHVGREGGLIAGAASGLFGGFAGEQGGLRAVGMLGFDLRKEAFVATSTAVGVAIDVARLPVYFATETSAFTRDGNPIVLVAATVGVVAGTLLGRGALKRVPEQSFKRVLGGALVVIGVLLLFHR
jgi:uncharacterized protein